MIHNLKTIDQLGIKALVKKRLECPEVYLNTPLIIWRSNIADGIQNRILNEACEDYNKSIPENEHKSFAITCDADFERALSETNGLVVLDPVGASIQWKRYPDTFRDFQNLLNNPGRYGAKSAPVVTFMPYHSEWFETPEVYTNAEQYLFKPDFEEWAVREVEIPKEIIDFIRGDGEKEGVMYRWYNFFNIDSSIPTGRPGVSFPEHWHSLLIALKNKAEDQGMSSIFDLSEEWISEEIKYQSGISEDVKDTLCKYIINLKNK
ncbi:MAG: hypothetical protein K2K97_09120 [Muribaculaceae bacterium]|nr:hypothetical protein [Muribaculaceae bacterium]